MHSHRLTLTLTRTMLELSIFMFSIVSIIEQFQSLVIIKTQALLLIQEHFVAVSLFRRKILLADVSHISAS